MKEPRSDKEKVVLYLNEIMNHMQASCPHVKDNTIYNILVDVEAVIEKICDNAIEILVKL